MDEANADFFGGDNPFVGQYLLHLEAIHVSGHCLHGGELTQGFEDIEHVSRYFKAQTGMTPREYRRRACSSTST